MKKFSRNLYIFSDINLLISIEKLRHKANRLQIIWVAAVIILKIAMICDIYLFHNKILKNICQKYFLIVFYRPSIDGDMRKDLHAEVNWPHESRGVTQVTIQCCLTKTVPNYRSLAKTWEKDVFKCLQK